MTNKLKMIGVSYKSFCRQIILKLSRCAAMIFFLPMFFMCVSCSNDDYINAIPENSTAVMAVDLERLTSSKSDNQDLKKIAEFFKIDNLDDCGIDFSKSVYMFETVEGNIGLLAKVQDKKDIEQTFEKMSADGYCKKISERRDICFTVIKDTWVTGFSSDAILIVGPVLPVAHAETYRQITKYLEQDEDEGIKTSPIYEKLSNIDSPIAVVAQAAALPEKFVAPFTLGAPEGTDASQIMIAAGLENSAGFIEIKGEPFVFNKDIDKALKKNLNVFRPITDRYLKSMPADALLGAFMNVNGKDFIKILHSNKAFQALLTGVNMAVDMDNIIRDVDGDMAFVFPTSAESGMPIRFAAKLGDKKFLGDVNYWKASCPQGSRIEDVGKDAYCYINGQTRYFFGVSDDMQYYSGTSQADARSSISVSQNTLPGEVMARIKGRRISFVFNQKAFSGKDQSGLLSSVMASLFGETNYIIYSMD